MFSILAGVWPNERIGFIERSFGAEILAICLTENGGWLGLEKRLAIVPLFSTSVGVWPNERIGFIERSFGAENSASSGILHI